MTGRTMQNKKCITCSSKHKRKTVKAHLQVRLCLSFYTENGALLRSMSSRSQHQHQRVQRVIRNIKNKKMTLAHRYPPKAETSNGQSETEEEPKHCFIKSLHTVSSDTLRYCKSQILTDTLRNLRMLSGSHRYCQILTDTLRNLQTLTDAVRYSQILSETYGYSQLQMLTNTLSYIILYYIILCYIILCYVIVRYIMLYYFMLCCVMLCYIYSIHILL